MKPMPKHLMIHSAELKEVSTDDTWQDENMTTIAALTRIRIEPSTKLVTSKDNRQVALSAIMLYDCYNSRPKMQEFSHGQKIVWNGIEYTVETIEKLYDSRKLHHIELGLV